MADPEPGDSDGNAGGDPAYACWAGFGVGACAGVAMTAADAAAAGLSGTGAWSAGLSTVGAALARPSHAGETGAAGTGADGIGADRIGVAATGADEVGAGETGPDISGPDAPLTGVAMPGVTRAGETGPDRTGPAAGGVGPVASDRGPVGVNASVDGATRPVLATPGSPSVGDIGVRPGTPRDPSTAASVDGPGPRSPASGSSGIDASRSGRISPIGRTLAAPPLSAGPA